jgi:asparagine synthase (glutamine-hydrolysing)
MFEGIHALKPGHYLRAGRDGVSTTEYWDLVYPERGNGAAGEPEAVYTERLEELLFAAVRRRLDADVPVGVYLSGGLDSSLIGAIGHAVRPAEQFHSFSITFPQSDIDERQYQRLMAAHLGSIHHETEFAPHDIISRLRRAVICAETPLKESYNTCSLALSALVRDSEHKVVLTGEGADELFAGYVGYRLDATGARTASGGSDLEAMLEDENRDLLWGDANFFYERDYLRFSEIKSSIYSEAVGAQLRSFDCAREPAVDTSKIRNRHPLHQRSYVDFKLRLADHLLADHGDRVAYANGVEARYPFLDTDLIEFVRSIPPDLLVKNATEKNLLRAVAGKYLPPVLASREKFGFVAPGTPYLLAQNIDWINDLLSPEVIRRQNYFNPDTVERLRARTIKGGMSINTTFDTDLLMLVLTFGIFLDAFGMPAYTA